MRRPCTNRLAALAGLVALLAVPLVQAAVAAAAPDMATPVPDPGAERARIDAERQAVQARFETARQACEARFAVTACLDEAKADRRHALEVLRQQQIRLDEAQRRARASDKRALLARRAEQAASAAPAAASRSDAPAPPPTTTARRRAAAVPASGPASAGGGAPSSPAAAVVRPAGRHVPRVDAASQHERDALSRQGFERRQDQARSHAAEVAQREALRKRPAAAPLPIPGAASAASR